ncbi:hypothetical protein CPB97_006791, partial [Podila verticillata]
MRQVYGDSLNAEVKKLLIAIRLRRKQGNPQPLDKLGEKDLSSPSVSDDESDQEYHGRSQPTIPKISNWREAVQQWEEGDPENGVTVPLRDWNLEMRRGQRRYYDRKMVAQEFEYQGRNEDKMRQV